MARRIRAPEENTWQPNVQAVHLLSDLVAALPEDVGDWQHINEKGNTVPRPEVMRFWRHVGLTAYMQAQAEWPDRRAVLEHLTATPPACCRPW